MSSIPPKADIRQREWHVRFVPQADIERIAGWSEQPLPRRVICVAGLGQRNCDAKDN